MLHQELPQLDSLYALSTGKSSQKVLTEFWQKCSKAPSSASQMCAASGYVWPNPVCYPLPYNNKRIALKEDM